MQASFYRVQKVAEILGMSVPTVWRKAKAEAGFPAPVKVSERITGWLSTEVHEYQAAKVAASRRGVSQ